MPRLPEDERRFVLPYYLKMMGLNAANPQNAIDPALLAGVHRDARIIDHATVVHFLRSEWRPRVMGAWYSVCQGPETIRAELLRSLESSAGSLTAPPLATAAAFVLGGDALPSLKIYISKLIAASDSDGSADFVHLLVNHLEGRPEAPGGRLDGYAERMLAVAAAIAGDES